MIRRLEHHYTQPLQLADMGELAILSPYRFQRIFKAVTSETPAEYLRRRGKQLTRQLYSNGQTQSDRYIATPKNGVTKPFAQRLRGKMRCHFRGNGYITH